MTINNIQNHNYNLKNTDLENMFKIHVDKNDNAVFNINETLYLNYDKPDLKVYITEHPNHWSTLSYKIYKTTRLAWLLMKLNNISTADCFKRVPPATPIFYLDEGIVNQILLEINKAD